MNERVKSYLKEAEMIFSEVFKFGLSATNTPDRAIMVEIAKMIQLEHRKQAKRSESPVAEKARFDPIEAARKAPRRPLIPPRITKKPTPKKPAPKKKKAVKFKRPA